MRQTQPSPLVMKQIADLLADAAGVDARALDPKRLQWVMEGRCRKLHISSPEKYVSHLIASQNELGELIDATVVTETRFFRDAAVFDHLKSWLPEMAAQFSGELRILSAPCSTGQEAYSIAALLIEAGIPSSRFTIDAFDISSAAVATAHEGRYPQEALRHVPAPLQRVCGLHAEKEWVMHEELRHRIHFAQRNLAQPDALKCDETQKYHLIFCRNLFIYLHAEARTALAASLAQALHPGGRLVLGSADRVEEIDRLFTSIRPAASFAFTHRTAVKPIQQKAPVASKPYAVTTRIHPLPVAPKMEGISMPPPPLTTAEGLYERALDDHRHGDLRRAERRCRQALYLDPQMLPAMELLESLWREHPNLRLRRALGARILRSRKENDTCKETA